MLSGTKDTEIEIMIKLNDRDLVSYCSINKVTKGLRDSETFWKRKIKSMLPLLSEDELDKYRNNRSWSNYYIKDLRKIKPYNSIGSFHDGIETNRLDWVMLAIDNGANIKHEIDTAIREAKQKKNITNYLKSLNPPEYGIYGIDNIHIEGYGIPYKTKTLDITVNDENGKPKILHFTTEDPNDIFGKFREICGSFKGKDLEVYYNLDDVPHNLKNIDEYPILKNYLSNTFYNGEFLTYTYLIDFPHNDEDYHIAIINSIVYMIYDDDGYILKVLVAPSYDLQIGDGYTSAIKYKDKNIIICNVGDVTSMVVIRFEQ